MDITNHEGNSGRKECVHSNKILIWNEPGDYMYYLKTEPSIFYNRVVTSPEIFKVPILIDHNLNFIKYSISAFFENEIDIFQKF